MRRQNLVLRRMGRRQRGIRDRHRFFWRPDDAGWGRLPAAPDAPGMRMHMHFGAEEMFFVLSGRPVFRNQHGEEEMAPGDFVFCPEGRAGLHAFGNPTEETVRSSRSVPGASRTSSLPQTRICVGGDSRSRSGATREGRRPRHHHSLRDPDRVDRSAVWPSLEHEEAAGAASSGAMGSRRGSRRTRAHAQ